MNDVLTEAFAGAQRSYHAACKTASRTGQLVASGPRALSLTHSKLSKAKEQLLHYSGWAYVAIRSIAHRIAGQSVHVARFGTRRRPGSKLVQSLPGHVKALGDSLEPLDGHPLLDTLDAPNPIQTRWQLMVSTIASLELTGRAYWWMPEGSIPAVTAGGIEIWPLPSSWVEAGDPLRGSWKIRTKWGQDFEVPGDEMALFSLPDPADPFGSVSPLQTQAPAVSTDEQIQVSQFRAFKNGLFPGLMIRAGTLPGMMPGQPGERPHLSAEQRQELIQSIRSICEGAANYGEPLILDAMIEGVERLTDKPAEMDFLDSGKAVKSRIMQAYGVNPLVVGEIEGANRAQAVVAEEVFVSNAVNPLLEMLSQAMTRWVCPRFARPTERLVCWIDPAKANDAEMSLRQWEVGLRSGAVGKGEYRTYVLNLPAELPPGDEPMSLFGSRAAPTTHEGNGRCSRLPVG